jgi:hypothetical protein
MATAKDDTVLRLLCHLAWLRDIVGSGPNQRTLGWARRVYNSAAHLQFRFVYPHQSQDRVAEPSQPLLAKAIESVVDAAADAVEPLRSGAGAVEDDSVLDAATTREVRDALNVLLDMANKIGWGGVHAPKKDATLDRPLNPLQLLAAWRRRHGGGTHTGSDSAASNDAMVELDKSIATKIVTNHSRVMRRVPTSASEAFHAAADAYLAVDLEEFGHAGGDQVIQRLATQMLRTRTRGVR